MTPPIEVEEVITPDVASSSPGFDAMDVSPLPHKPPHFVAQVTFPSPTPDATPDDDGDVTIVDLLSPHDQPIAQVQAQPNLAPPPSFFQIPEYVCSLPHYYHIH